MSDQIKKLNLGCGEDIKAGYINVDFHDHVEPDVVHDLNDYPYPFEESTFDEVIALPATSCTSGNSSRARATALSTPSE